MQKYTFIIIVLIAAISIVGCKKPIKKFSTTRIDPNSQNFTYLDKALKDVKILALGESSHSFGSMHRLKGNMIKHLHKNLGFDLLVFEAGFGDTGLAWHNSATGDTAQIMEGMLPEILRSEQMLPLITYAKQNKDTETPLGIEGMDPKISARAFNFKLMFVIKRLEPKVIQDSILNGFKAFDRSFDVLDNEEEWTKNINLYRGAIDLSQSILNENIEDIEELQLADKTELDILIKFLDMMEAKVDYEYGQVYTRGLALRDSIMAENVAMFLEENPKAKIIIWAHNGHIEKGPGVGDDIKWLGHYLKERYGDDYYAMGMYAKKGYIYQASERKTSNFDISYPTFIEGKMDADYGQNVFMDLPLYDETNTGWYNKLIYGYELEAGGQVQFIPTKRFDGVVLLGETEAPTYITTNRERR